MVSKVHLRAAFAYDGDEASFSSGLCCEDLSLAQQQFKDECDINTIVSRFGMTGELPGDFSMPVSGDFTKVVDFHSAMNLVRQAEESFMEVPAHVRARFGNDPARMIEFLEDGGNRAEAEKLGLVAKPVEAPRDVVKAIDDLVTHLKAPKA